MADSLDERLAALDLDGFAAHFRVILPVDVPPAAAAARVLRELDRLGAHALKGRLLSNLGRHAEARRTLERAALDAQGRVWLGAALLLENRVADAVRELEAALALDPAQAWGYFHRAAARYVMGETDAAAADLAEAERRGTGSPVLAARAFGALLEAKAGRVEAALARVDAVIAALPPRSRPHLLRAAVRRMGGDHKGALADYRAALTVRSSGWVLAERASALEALGRRREAVADLTAALRLDGPDGALNVRRGRLELARGRRAAAEADLRRALKLGADDGTRGFALELAAAERGRAARILADLARRRPADGEVRFLLAQARGTTAEFSRAAAVLRRELAASARRADLWLLLARAEERRGAFVAAEAAAREAASLEPESGEALALLASLLRARGRAAEARAALRRIRSLPKEPAAGDAQGWSERLRLAAALGNFAEAARCGEAVLDAARDSARLEVLNWPFAFEETDRDETSLAQRGELLAALERFLAAAPRSPWGLFYRGALDASRGADLEAVAGFPAKRYGWMRWRLAKLRVRVDGNFDRALPHFRAAARFPSDGHWLSECSTAEALLCRGDERGAAAALRAAEQAVPRERRAEFLTWKGELLLWMGRFREALAALDAGIAGGAARNLGHCWRGGALLLLGRTGEALAALDRGLALLPGDVEARLWRAEVLLRQGRFADSLAETAAAAEAGGGGAGFYVDVVAGLAARGAGDAAALRAAHARLPTEVDGFVRRKLGLGSGGDEAALAAVLEGVLTLSRGIRRGGYEPAIWMR